MLSYLVGLDGGSTEKGAEKLLGQVDRSGQGGTVVFTKKQKVSEKLLRRFPKSGSNGAIGTVTPNLQ